MGWVVDAGVDVVRDGRPVYSWPGPGLPAEQEHEQGESEQF